MGSAVRTLKVELSFNLYFLSWVVAQNFRHEYPLDFYTMGWEL